jgi:hypothetical protein
VTYSTISPSPWAARPVPGLAARLSIPTSPDTLLRLARREHSVREPRPPVRVLGVDDWAWRRGHRYGTALVDLERNRVLDLPPDRQAETLAAWPNANPGVEVVAHDRGSAYADGVRQGAPDAVQVADRWHPLRKLGDAVHGAAERHHAAARWGRAGGDGAAPIVGAPDDLAVDRTTAAERRREAARARAGRPSSTRRRAGTRRGPPSATSPCGSGPTARHCAAGCAPTPSRVGASCGAAASRPVS